MNSTHGTMKDAGSASPNIRVFEVLSWFTDTGLPCSTPFQETSTASACVRFLKCCLMIIYILGLFLVKSSGLLGPKNSELGTILVDSRGPAASSPCWWFVHRRHRCEAVVLSTFCVRLTKFHTMCSHDVSNSLDFRFASTFPIEVL